MKARARLVVELDGRGHSVVRTLRSAAPLSLMPARRSTGPAVVRLLNSAAAPLAGDDLELTVRVGPGARLALSGVAATLALPGHRFEPSRFALRLSAGVGAEVSYLPEPTVVTSRARHESYLYADLAAGAALHCREVLVLGRAGERPGRLTTATHLVRAGRPVLRQCLEIGDETLAGSLAMFAGRRVLATEIRLDDTEPARPASGDWWSRSPLAGGGSIATALAEDAVAALRWLELAGAERGILPEAER
ncbi:urease accessory protein UreD [Actinophytocola sp.]|uniref:urease accessory protein UreD n=1 Tax=Actinophytocola sp. TaxID=1872138 RepID=UPI002D7E553C|nr:urease accessory protein UreD [Actinophytocola sp.]HET9137893.1 urease accessory protein UreD [Actinophytocola sp.]HEU5109098.1 urease accessory protein UreD [Micromonosporaceae bacterium]